MTWEEFYRLLFGPDFNILISYFLFFLVILFFTYRKNINNLFDPLNIMIINLSSCFTIIIYLFLKNLIVEKYFFQLIFINFFFLLTFKITLSKKKLFLFKNKLDIKFFKIYYFIHSLFFILIVFYFYKLIDSKLFEDKLNTFNGMGILRYASIFLFPGQLILIFIKREAYNIKRKIDYLIILLIFFLFLFSGGRTATISYLLYIFSIFYFLNLIKKNKKYKTIKKYSYLFAIFGFIGIIFLFNIRIKSNSTITILKGILHRVLSSGDIYYMAYVNNNIEKIEGISLINYYVVSLINPILRRIINVKENVYPGFQIMKIVYGMDINYCGPNTRYDFVLQMNLGFFGIIGGILTGFLMGVIRKIKSLNFIFLQIVIVLFVNIEYLTIDFGLFSMYFFSCCFMLSILSLISFLIYKLI